MNTMTYVVALLLSDLGGAVALRLHYVHDVVTGCCGTITGAPPLLAAALHRLVLSRLRPLLHVLEGLRGIQQRMERAREAEARALGSRPTSMLLVTHPLLYHDACTLYWGLLGGWAGGAENDAQGDAQGGDWAGTACVSPPQWDACACGESRWGLTCTPPRLHRGRLLRDVLDDCVAFCWKCMARRPVELWKPDPMAIADIV